MGACLTGLVIENSRFSSRPRSKATQNNGCFISVSFFVFPSHPFMSQVAGGCKQFASWAFVGDNGGMKRPKAAQEKTGAPSAIFLSALEMDAPIDCLITGTRNERKSHALVTSDELGKRIWLDLMELADRVSNPKLMGKSFDDSESAENLAIAAKSVCFQQVSQH
jgi:hypothetical protein